MLRARATWSTRCTTYTTRSNAASKRKLRSNSTSKLRWVWSQYVHSSSSLKKSFRTIDRNRSTKLYANPSIRMYEVWSCKHRVPSKGIPKFRDRLKGRCNLLWRERGINFPLFLFIELHTTNIFRILYLIILKQLAHDQHLTSSSRAVRSPHNSNSNSTKYNLTAQSEHEESRTSR